MGLEQLADVNRAMEQHHNTLWDVHLRQTLCDAKHLSQSCQRKFIDFSFCFLDLVPTLGFAREAQLANGSLRGGFSQFILKQKEGKIKVNLHVPSFQQVPHTGSSKDSFEKSGPNEEKTALTEIHGV